MMWLADVSAGEAPRASVPGTAASVGNNGRQSKPMPTLKLGSTVIHVENGAKRIMDFYHAAFGLQIRYYDSQLDFGELETATDATIMISSFAAGEVMMGDKFPRKPSSIELAFLTADVPAAYAKAIAAGAKPVSEPKKMPWGQTAAYVTSIEGTLIALLTPPPPVPKPGED
jgi:lactoylglutathione lyase